MPRILAIETSSRACSAALLWDGRVFERREATERGHSEHLLEMAGDLLAEAGATLSALEAVAFGRGPGSFTGVRVAAAVAQGLAFGSGAGVIPVSSLAALALQGIQASGCERALVATDARMGEVYWGAFCVRGGEGLEAVGPERVLPPAAAPVPAGSGWVGVGDGWEAHREVLRARCGGGLAAVLADRMPQAREVLALAVPEAEAGRILAPEEALPVYLRDRVVQSPGR